MAAKANGEPVVNHQGDVWESEDLEETAYKYVLQLWDAGEEHTPGMRKNAKLVESIVFKKEKMAAIGIPEGIVPEGWWVGFKVLDDLIWQKIKDGQYTMFSVEGHGIREPVESPPVWGAWIEI